MGALFSLFNTSELHDFELEWAKTHPQDAMLYAECRKMLKTCSEIIASIDNYSGAKEEIKNAMSAPVNTDEQKQAIRIAMIKVIPNASLAQSWMEFAQKLGKFLINRLLPRLSAPLSGDGDDDDDDNDNINANANDVDDIDYDEKKDASSENVSELTVLTHQALAREFCLMLDFLLMFDSKKMREPQIQNDFSFYKRTLNKQNHDYLSDLDWPVTNERAGFISMFLAQAIPLLKEVAQCISTDAQCVKILAIFCNGLLDLLKENKFGKDKDSQLLALRAMTASFVIYDHANTEFGAFQRRSATKAQKIVSMIANDYSNLYGENEIVQELKNIVKFASAHYNEDSTAQSIKNLLE